MNQTTNRKESGPDSGRKRQAIRPAERHERALMAFESYDLPVRRAALLGNSGRAEGPWNA